MISLLIKLISQVIIFILIIALINLVVAYKMNTKFALIVISLTLILLNLYSLKLAILTGKIIIVGSVYRPPNQNYMCFMDKFCDILSIISINKLCYILRVTITSTYYVVIIIFQLKNSSKTYFRICLSL